MPISEHPTPNPVEELLWQRIAYGTEQRLRADVMSGRSMWRRERRATVRRYIVAAAMVAAMVIPAGFATAQTLTLDMQISSPLVYRNTASVSLQIVQAL